MIFDYSFYVSTWMLSVANLSSVVYGGAMQKWSGWYLNVSWAHSNHTMEAAQCGSEPRRYLNTSAGYFYIATNHKPVHKPNKFVEVHGSWDLTNHKPSQTTVFLVCAHLE